MIWHIHIYVTTPFGGGRLKKVCKICGHTVIVKDKDNGRTPPVSD